MCAPECGIDRVRARSGGSVDGTTLGYGFDVDLRSELVSGLVEQAGLSGRWPLLWRRRSDGRFDAIVFRARRDTDFEVKAHLPRVYVEVSSAEAASDGTETITTVDTGYGVGAAVADGVLYEADVLADRALTPTAEFMATYGDRVWRIPSGAELQPAAARMVTDILRAAEEYWSLPIPWWRDIDSHQQFWRQQILDRWPAPEGSEPSERELVEMHWPGIDVVTD